MTRPPVRSGSTGLMLALACWAFAPASAFADDEAGETQATRSAWQIEKCEVYETALADILDHVGRDGVSPLFLARNTEFIESGCLADIDACPQTDKDVEIANGLTIATMNAGAASSFSPFRCRS
jgi:hypothetical protein